MSVCKRGSTVSCALQRPQTGVIYLQLEKLRLRERLWPRVRLITVGTCHWS